MQQLFIWMYNRYLQDAKLNYVKTMFQEQMNNVVMRYVHVQEMVLIVQREEHVFKVKRKQDVLYLLLDNVVNGCEMSQILKMLQLLQHIVQLRDVTLPQLVYEQMQIVQSILQIVQLKVEEGVQLNPSCSAASVNAACITALNGTICAWDYTLNECRDKDCQDFIGTTHTICQTQRQGCTAGPNACELTTIREASIEGTNGPCLWIEKFVNSDGSKGACFTYTSCKSLAWNNDESCKLISNKCTTNGTNCIGINYMY
ncbi:unnamed protein product (macronuclear) [Paramecium tetraurelia]|uniref:Uncharacterized protein n=1 Tax=Paramecium tetraurelia TaxID=5888 RepID=A0CHJ0_PARTE|nr:uncharacterized protein GSPATT00038359001 [Paramecium tetraurelia]CAK70257.1 unnamed protein product [Paramecium tetraurelia]|eukprot:XP_001437654.1 hypothetical protein (macronuclear) [Paramecium tetraurelia strain d4-2]